MTQPIADGFVPGRFPLDAYGRGGFRFGGLSHRGSILALLSGTRAWRPLAIGDMVAADLDPVFVEEPRIEFLILGTGAELFVIPEAFRRRFRDAGIQLDSMQTGPAARTYNVLLAEERRVGAALIAVA